MIVKLSGRLRRWSELDQLRVVDLVNNPPSLECAIGRNYARSLLIIPGASILPAWKLVEMLLYVKEYTEKAAVTEDWAMELPTIAFRLGSGRRVAAILEDLLDKRNMTDVA